MLDVNLASTDYEMILNYANLHSDARKELIKNSENRLERKHPVLTSEMLEGVLYDGYDEKCDNFRFNSIRTHNHN